MPLDHHTLTELGRAIKAWGAQLGFQQVGIGGIDLSDAEPRLRQWLANGYHGEMAWMTRHDTKRSRPAELEPGTLSIISVRMDYHPHPHEALLSLLQQPERAYISRYALGRDYHKLMRKRLQRLAEQIRDRIGPFGFRVYVDSAPVLEKPIAQQAGLGWQGKHTNLVNRDAGSWFFLGEIYTDLPLPRDPPYAEDHCGTCNACIDICPTRAIVEPYVVDARRCISYLTIEHPGSIPPEFRAPIGNRIYGCDDCQLVCPWNRFAQSTLEHDFLPRQGLDQATLLALFAWDETTFLNKTEGSAIRRIGHDRWLRNIAIALGNGPHHGQVISALQQRLHHASELVREHIHWALAQQEY